MLGSALSLNFRRGIEFARVIALGWTACTRARDVASKLPGLVALALNWFTTMGTKVHEDLIRI
jgi:hypothetical protein